MIIHEDYVATGFRWDVRCYLCGHTTLYPALFPQSWLAQCSWYMGEQNHLESEPPVLSSEI